MSVENASEFAERRERSNEAVLRRANVPVKRFFALDQDVYEDRAPAKRTKELLGLIASTVLRCNDCISHHLSEATAAGATEAEVAEALGIARVVGARLRFLTCGTRLSASNRLNRRNRHRNELLCVAAHGVVA